jgi:hypothetical protein
MDLLAVILACSLHPDDALVRTLVDVESSGNVYFVGDLATLKTNDSLKSAEAALRFAEDLRRHGGRPAVGLLGVPLEWAGRYGRAPIELFDACTNVAVATAAFADYHRRCSAVRPRSGHRSAATGHPGRRRDAAALSLRYCVVSRYARDLGLAIAPATTLQRLISERGWQPSESSSLPIERSPILWNGHDDISSEMPQPMRPRIFLDEFRLPAEPH